MQPPRTRTPRIDIGNIEILRALILNTTAVILTLIVMRVATLLVSDSADAAIPGLIQTITEPLVWPFKFLPVLGATVVADITVVDLLMIPGIVVIGLLISGVLTGWRESASQSKKYSAPPD